MKESALLFFANASEPATNNGDMFASIGIDWTVLLLNIVAFLILLWLLKRFVYPPLVKMLDEREKDIESARQAAMESEKHAETAKAEIDKLLKEARGEAADIVATAKAEATSMVEQAGEKSRAQADRLVAEAHDTIGKEVLAARKTLHNETIDLVAQATEKVIGKTLTPKLDDAVIADALKEAR